MTMLARKLFISATVFATAVALYRGQRPSLVEARRENLRLRLEMDRILKATKYSNEKSEAIRAQLGGLEQRAKALEQEAAAAIGGHSVTAVPSTGQSGGAGMQYVALRKANLNRIEFKPLGDDYRLTDEAALILGLTATERESVDRAAGKVVAKHGELDLNKARKSNEHLTAEEGRKTTFKVPAYPEEGGKMAATLLGETQEAIGQERTQLLLAHAGLDTLSGDGFEPFGRTEKTITFLDREGPGGDRGDCKVFLKVVDMATGFTLTTSFANTDDSIPRNWRHLIANITTRDQTSPGFTAP